MAVAVQERLYPLLSDVSASLVFSTRLPLPIAGIEPDRSPSESAWAFSVVGALAGGVGAAVYALAFGVGVPPLPAATLAVAGMVLATGALHEGELAAAARGLAGGRDREAGPAAAATLVIALLLRIGAAAALADPWTVGAALVAAGALSRAALATVMHAVGAAPDDEAAVAAGRPTVPTAALSCAVAALLSLIVLPAGAAVAAILAAAALGAAVALAARAWFGGTTGDVFGATQQTAEIACLVALAAILTPN